MVSVIIMAALFAASLPSSSHSDVSGGVGVGAGETLLEVSATGRVKAVPDVAEISIGVTTDGGSAKIAMASNSAIAERLIAVARATGIPSAALRTESVSVHPVYRNDKDGDETDRVTGYSASNRLKVRVTDVSKAPDVVDALIGAGATNLEGPNFSFSDNVTQQRNARVAAVQAARAEADDYAAALGMHVARVVRVSERSSIGEGGSDIVVTGSLRGARAPVQPGEQETTVTVWIDYALTRN
jgi:uncharacterized protein YggE